MTQESSACGDRDWQVNEIVCAYLEAVDAGQTLDRQEWLGRYPEFAAELEAFLADYEHVDRLAEPLRPAVPPEGVVSGVAETLGAGQAAGWSVGATIRYLGDYELLAEIARGGMGVVYKARQISLNRIVAVKMILAGVLATKADHDRFHSEAQAAALLDHPNILPVFEVGEHEGQHYFSMGYVDGQSLAARLAEGPLPPNEAAELVAVVAEAVEYAHRQGVIHRDIKPSNILIDSNGRPRVTDFGLAKRVGSDSDLTTTGQVLGTPSYMAPEQAAGQINAVGPAADVYGLGALLYATLAGRPPFQAATSLETLQQVLDREPVALRQLNPGVPRDLETIALKCLEKSVPRRYATARALAEDLRRYLEGRPILARPVGRAEYAWRWCRRNPVVAALSALAFLLFATVAIVATVGYLQTTRALGIAHQREGEAISSQKKAEAAAASESKAHEEETLTLADAHTSLGLIAAEQNNPYEAVLWFASAANLARTDPQRELANRTRFATWARGLAYPVAVLPHPGQDVTRIIFHPSDDYLLSFTGNDRYTIYDVRTGRLAELSIASKGQGCAEWSPDGKLLALGDAQGRVDIFGFPECRLLHALKHPGAIRTLRFSDDVAYLAIGSKVVRVWSTANKDFLAGELRHPQAVVGIDFDPENRRLVTSCADGLARVFAIDGKQLAAHTLFPSTPHAVSTNLYLATGFCATFVKNTGLLVSKDHSAVRLLDADTGAEIRRFVPPREYVTTIRVSPDRSTLIICGKRTCQLWDAARPDGAMISLEQPEGVLDAAFHPAGNSVVTAGLNGRAHFWSVPGGEPLDAPLPHQDSVKHVAYSSSGKFLATAQEGGLVRVWPLPPRAKTLHVSASPLSGPFRLVLSRDGRLVLASGAWPGAGISSIQVYDTASGAAIGLPLAAGAPVNGADFSPDGSRMIAAVAPSPNGRGKIVLRDWRSAKQCFPAIPTPSAPADVSYSPRGDYAVAVCVKGEVVIIDANTAQVRKCANHQASAVYWWKHPKRWVVFSPDGSHFATLGLGYVVRIWTPMGELAGSVEHRDTVRQAVFSPKGDYLATASDDYSAQVCSVASGKLLAVLRHPGWVSAVQFSPDQRQLLTACTDDMARLWDWKTGRLVCPGFEHKDEVWDAGFMPDRPWILTLGMDSTVRGWESRTGKAIMPPLGLSPGVASDLHDLMIARDGKLMAVPGTGKFDVCDVADTGLVERQEFDLAGLQSMAELYAGRQIVGSGSVKLTADEWLQRWKSLLANYSGSAPVEPGGAAAGYGGFTQVVRRISAASIDAEVRRNAAAARRLALIGKPLELDGTALDGKPFDWGAYRGRVTLVEFQAHYSAESESLRAAMPLYALYHDVGLEVVGINLDDDRRVIERFVAETKIPWTTVCASAAGLRQLADQCGISEVPMSLLVDRDGKVVSQSVEADEFTAKLRELLGPPFQGPLTCLDLQGQANWNLNENYWSGNPPGSDLASLPRGEGDFAGVKFCIGASALRLGGKASFPTLPKRIENIPINIFATKLYFLHATGWGSNEGTPIGAYVIQYADGGVRSMPILFGSDLRGWWAYSDQWGDSARPATVATVAWQGRLPNNMNIQLFLSVWTNPRPATKIKSLDYVSKMTDAAPFCVAITAEGPSSSTPGDKAVLGAGVTKEPPRNKSVPVPTGRLKSIDLQAKANLRLTESFDGSGRPNNLAELPQGEQVLAGVKFTIGKSLIQLGNRYLPDKLRDVKAVAIPVDKTFTRLYILHGTQWGPADDGMLIGQYRLHFEDGTVAAIPIVFGEDVRDWWNGDGSKAVSDAIVAWDGQNAASGKEKFRLRLYLAAWDNPHPEKKVVSIEFLRDGPTDAAPFCVAMTVEEHAAGNNR